MKTLQPIALIGYLLVNLFTVLGYVKLLSYYTTTSPATMFWITFIFWMIMTGILFGIMKGNNILRNDKERLLSIYTIEVFFAILISLLWILHTEGFFVALKNLTYEVCCSDEIITKTPKDLLFPAIIVSGGFIFGEFMLSAGIYNIKRIKDLIIIFFYLIIAIIIPFVLLSLVHSFGILNLSSYEHSSVFLGVTNVLIFFCICIGLHNNSQIDIKKTNIT